jgi:hypothetical protein
MFSINWKNFNNPTETDAQVLKEISVAAAALNKPSDATSLQITVERGTVAAPVAATNDPILRFYYHGTDPTANVGIPLYDGESRAFTHQQLHNLKFISADGNDHRVHCQWIKAI